MEKINQKMKHFLLLTIVLLTIESAFGQVKVYNDQRDELSGIVWQLAGAHEFSQKISDTTYSNDIKTYFAKFTKHPLMDFIRSMREEPFFVGYNAVPGAAHVLKIENGAVKLSSTEDVAKFTTKDTRWTIDNMRRYVSLLNDFYRKSKFERFYKAHQPVYQRYVDSLRVVVSSVDTQWFESFYGVSLNDFEVISCPSYGASNFGSVSDFEITIGGWSDLNIEQKYNIRSKNVVLHELNHIFSYRIIEPYMEQLRPAAEKIFPYVEARVTELGHGEAFTVVQESLNELFSMMYFKYAEKSALTNEIISAYYHGFLWIERALRYMDNFHANRDIYPSISDFMPQLVGFINLTADNMDALSEDYKRTPRVVSSFPANGSVVPPSLKEVRIHFSHPMSVGLSHCGLEQGDVLSFLKPYDEEDESDDFYWADDYTLVYPVTAVLEKGKQYGIQILKGFLRRKNTGVQVDQKYELIFKVE